MCATCTGELTSRVRRFTRLRLNSQRDRGATPHRPFLPSLPAVSTPPGRGPASSPWRRFPPRLLDTRPAPSLRRPAGFAHVALFAPGVASRSTDVLRFTCVCLGHGHLGGFSFRGAMSTAAMNMPFAEHPPAYMRLPRRGIPGPHAHAWLGWASLPALID